MNKSKASAKNHLPVQSNSKNLIVCFVAGFILSLAGMMLEDFYHKLSIPNSFSQFNHFLIPLCFGLIGSLFGYLFWGKNHRQLLTLKQLTQSLNSLLDVNKAFISSIDLDTILQLIIDKSTRLINLDTGAIYLHEDEKLKLGATTPALPPQFPEAIRYDLLANHPHIQKALATKKPVSIPDTSKEMLSEAEQAIVEVKKLRSILYIPLIIENRPVGTLILGTTHSLRTFTTQEINIYNTFSSQAALSIENARLYKKSIQIADELRQQNEELKIAKQKADESDILKTAILQNMSHEIRTPMNAIMGFADLLKENFDNKPKLEKYTEIITYRCNDLLEIIDDILDIAKIESGQLSVNNEECNLNEFFADLSAFFTEYQRRTDKQHIHLKLQASCDLSECMLLTDKVKLKQIFINLISNAFKFTDEGKIEGGCFLDNKNQIRFYVSDTGIGIPADKQKAVFERFVQLRQNTKKNIGGTGLGLPIVKGLVSLLGSEIFLESEPNKGSTFWFLIPYKSARSESQNPKKIEQPTHKSIIQKTILVVEDDFYNSEYLKEILSGVASNVLLAEDGKQAIDLSLSHPVDIVFMDIRLPDMNGYEVMHTIRQHKPHLKVIAQTAYATPNEKQKALDAGFNDYLTKPTKRDLFLSMLFKHLE